MRIDYSLIDTFQNRTHSDIAFWGNIAVAGNYDGFRVLNTETHIANNRVSSYPSNTGPNCQ